MNYELRRAELRSAPAPNFDLRISAPVRLRRASSIYFVMGADGFEQDGLAALVGDEAEDDPQIVPGARGPRPFKLAAQLVGF